MRGGARLLFAFALIAALAGGARAEPLLWQTNSAGERVTLVDVAAGHVPIGEIAFAGSVRPSALSADGRLFHHVDGLNGFQVAELRRRAVVATLAHRTPLGWLLVHPKLGWAGPAGLQRCHGLAVSPDQSELWSACGASVTIHAIGSARYPELARIELADDAYWLTFSPDGRFALVALADAGQVTVVDARSRRIVAHLAAGAGPKRNLVLDPGGAFSGPPCGTA